MRILIASTAFPDSVEMLRKRLPDDEVIVDAGEAGGEFDVIVPLMRRIDAAMMDRHRPRLIQQCGVGLVEDDDGGRVWTHRWNLLLPHPRGRRRRHREHADRADRGYPIGTLTQ